MRDVRAIIQAQTGRRGFRQFPITRISAYTVDTAMDTDTDPFSIDIAAPGGDYSTLLGRDTEIRVNLFTGLKGQAVEQLHSGIADKVTFDSDDRTLSIAGRDYSCVATDSDAAPGKWKHVRPAAFIADRARKLGIANVKIARMSEIGTLVTDGSETEWALWYRIMRQKKMWIWFEPNGRLIGDFLNADPKPTYHFGSPVKGQNGRGWLSVERLEITKADQDRVGEVWVYGQDPKTQKTFFGRGIDTTISSWKRRPIRILTSTTAKNPADVKKEADDEVFESIVGSTEVTLTIRDPGFIIKQNTTAQVNIPELDFTGVWFIVGVRVRGGMEGFYQEVRLRERGFALSKRVPDPPKLTNNLNDPAETRSTQSIADVLAENGGTKYGRAFVRAAQEHHDGWELSLFLGVLMSIAQHESSTKNVRQRHDGAINDVEWYPKPTESLGITASSPETGPTTPSTVDQLVQRWRESFANEAGSPHNPYGNAEAGVGIMQLTDIGFKQRADEYGWNDKAKAGELDGGRWNPESNIRAGAWVLAQKLLAVHADPNNPDDIWRGVVAYNGSGAAAEAYMEAVKKIWKNQFQSATESAVAIATSLPVGTKVNITASGHTFKFPDDMPDIVAVAINFAFRHLGDPYRWGAPNNPNDSLPNGHLLYDCSSFVAAALYAGGVRAFPQPHLGDHGLTTTGLYALGESVTKDNLRPGDLVFFEPDIGHVGMYLDDGLFVHDPHTGEVVKISSLNDGWYREQYQGARRYVAWPGREQRG